MLATGGSASATISRLKEEGVKKIKLLCVVAAPEGINLIEKDHPDVQIYCATVDRTLNESAYILPGLGAVSYTHLIYSIIHCSVRASRTKYRSSGRNFFL